MSHSVLVLLVASSIWSPIQEKPRPCAKSVVVETDTTIQRLNAESRSLLEWSMRAQGPEYPRELRSQAAKGSVVARFAVDTNGRVVAGTAAIVSETHREFGSSVCQFLRRAQFRVVPFEGRKRSVTVLEAPFQFSLGQRY